MLFGEFFQRFAVSFDETALLKEAVNLLRCGLKPCCTHAIARQNLGVREFGREVPRAGSKPAASEGAERNYLLAVQVNAVQEGCHRESIGSEPHRVAEEDNIVRGNVAADRINLRQNSKLALFDTALDNLLI